VILSNAKQSASEPCDIVGGLHNKCLCRLIKEKDGGLEKFILASSTKHKFSLLLKNFSYSQIGIHTQNLRF
jgi:hypothetical protein